MKASSSRGKAGADGWLLHDVTAAPTYRFARRRRSEYIDNRAKAASSSEPGSGTAATVARR